MVFTLAIGLTLALVLGILAQRLSISPLVGYLVAGMLAAQPWWGYPVDSHVVEEFSHIGVVLLLFGVGLQFHFKDLVAVKGVAVPGALAVMACMMFFATCVYYFLGIGDTGWATSLIFGMCICVSSTVVLTRVLSDNKMLQSPAGHTALGWLVVEDIFTIILLILLPVFFSGEELGPALGWMAVKLPLLIVCVAFLGRTVISKVLTYVARNASGELFTLAVLVFALGIAVLSSSVFDASMEFGAFLSGMVVGQSRFASRAAADALPMKDAFAVLFFVSVGMGFDISGIMEHWMLAGCTVALTLVVKPAMAFIVIRLLRKPLRTAIAVGASLSQIGEFSFILATLCAVTYKVLPLETANVITGVAIITIALNAALYRFVPRLIDCLEGKGYGLPRYREGCVCPPREDKHRVIVVGYGPCGQIISSILKNYDVEVVVIEMNIDTVEKLSRQGVPVLHGDARLRPILIDAGCEQARAIIVTAPNAPAPEIAQAAHGINPRIGVMAHTTYIRNARNLRAQGAESVFSGEEEAALSMASHLLRNLGATEEQVARERRHNRRLLSGEKPEADDDSPADCKV